MRPILFPLFLLALSGILMIWQACNRFGPCEEVFCDDYLQVRFLSVADHSDLYATGTYHSDSLRVLALHTDGSTSDETHRISQSLYSGARYFNFSVLKDDAGYIFQYDSQKQDTLSAVCTRASTSCCDVVTTFSFGIFQGDTVFINPSRVLVLKI